MDAHTFATLTVKPTLDQIDLIVLTDYYEKYLEPFQYEFELEDGNEIKLKFNRDNFCHLLGIHKPAEKKFGKGKPQIYSFKGMKGYMRIKDGTINKAMLKGLNKSAYNDMRSSLVNFYQIHRMLDNPQAVYYTNVVNRINSVDILIYNQTINSYIHLGIVKKERQNYYSPSTFLIESITAHSAGNKFIEGQTPLTIIKTSKANVSNTVV